MSLLPHPNLRNFTCFRAPSTNKCFPCVLFSFVQVCATQLDERFDRCLPPTLLELIYTFLLFRVYSTGFWEDTFRTHLPYVDEVVIPLFIESQHGHLIYRISISPQTIHCAHTAQPTRPLLQSQVHAALLPHSSPEIYSKMCCASSPLLEQFFFLLSVTPWGYITPKTFCLPLSGWHKSHLDKLVRFSSFSADSLLALVPSFSSFFPRRFTLVLLVNA